MSTQSLDLSSLVSNVRRDLAAWEKAEADRASISVLTGTPFVVAQADCSLALRIEGNTAIPVVAGAPSACGGILGSSQMTRRDAERISTLRGDGYVVVPVREIPARRIAALREMLSYLENLNG